MRKAYEGAIPAESFANMVAFAMSQPEDVDVNEILFRVSMGYFNVAVSVGSLADTGLTIGIFRRRSFADGFFPVRDIRA